MSGTYVVSTCRIASASGDETHRYNGTSVQPQPRRNGITQWGQPREIPGGEAELTHGTGSTRSPDDFPGVGGRGRIDTAVTHRKIIEQLSLLPGQLFL